MKRRKKTANPQGMRQPHKDDGLFDDCPICQAMRDGRGDTLDGLLAAFREAKKMYPHSTYIAEDESRNQ